MAQRPIATAVLTVRERAGECRTAEIWRGRSARDCSECGIHFVVTMNFRDEPVVVHHIDLGETDPIGPSIFRFGPFDFDVGGNTAWSRGRFHDRWSYALAKKLLHVSDDVVAVAAERFAVRVLAPGRVLREKGAEGVDVPSVERAAELCREAVVHDAILPGQELRWRAPTGSFASSEREAFFEADRDAVTGLLLDQFPQLTVDGQLVCAVAEGHEGSLERLPVDGASDLHATASAGGLQMRLAGVSGSARAGCTRTRLPAWSMSVPSFMDER